MSDLLDQLVADHPDPLARYHALTAAQRNVAALLARFAEERGAAVREMYDSGMSYGEIGELIGVSRQRAYQLAEWPTSRACDLRDTGV